MTPSILMMAYTNYESDPRVIRAAEAALEGPFSVDVIALRRAGQPPVESIRGVRVLRVSQERYRGASRLKYLQSYAEFFLRCAVAATRLVPGRRYKVVHVNNMPDALVFAALVPRVLGSKIILDIHDPSPETFGAKFDGARGLASRILLWVERLSVAFANRTITVSEPLKRGVLSTHGYAPDTIGVISNFADDELFRPIAYPPVDGAVRFVFHGTILERNGLGVLLDAVGRVRNRNRIRVRIIGEGDFSGTVARMVESQALGDVVEFVNRAYPLHEIPSMLADCHVGLVPLLMSKVANFALPLKLVEYTCLGMPSISVRNAAIEHYFRPDECMFFDSGDARALAALLDRVAEAPECLREYRAKVQVARERMRWSTEKEKYIRLLRDLAGLPTAAAG